MGSKSRGGMAQPTYLPTTGTDLSQFNSQPNQGFQWNKPQGFKDATESNIGTSNYTPNFLFQDSQFGMNGFQGQSNGSTNPATGGNVGYNFGNQMENPASNALGKVRPMGLMFR